MQGTSQERRAAIRELAARKARELPLLPSGFWFHDDVRDNFYYAIHLFAACVGQDVKKAGSGEADRQAFRLAADMIGKVLKLQVQEEVDPMYGHWPLRLSDNPAESKPNSLPVELMGCLLIYFYHTYLQELPLDLKSDINIAILHIYQSGAYRRPLQKMNHHEAKHTALKLLLGHQFDDRELLEEGVGCMQRQLAHIKQFGFKEYGSLPWHWHWIQAFTCVQEVVDDPRVLQTAGGMLDHLWSLRADFYLKGAWVGAHSRQWPHDAPLDNNALADYIAFGDFPLPAVITRLEGWGLFRYEIAESIVARAVSRELPVALTRKIRFAGADGEQTEEAHTYTYIAREYAVGGVWERRDEFDNEQQRWDVTVPLSSQSVANGNSVNQLFFFHPGAKHIAGDDRHASPYGDVLFHKDAVIQLWWLPADAGEVSAELIGCLPKGDWRFLAQSGYGRIGDVYVVFHLMNEYDIVEKEDRISIASSLGSGLGGVVVEAMSCREASVLGIDSVDRFADSAHSRRAVFACSNDADGAYGATSAEGQLEAFYKTKRNDELALQVRSTGMCSQSVNGEPVNWSEYRVN